MKKRPSENLKKAIISLVEKRTEVDDFHYLLDTLREAYFALLQELGVPVAGIIDEERTEELSELREVYFIPSPMLSKESRSELKRQKSLLYTCGSDGLDEMTVVNPIPEINGKEVFKLGYAWEIWDFVRYYKTRERVEHLFQYELWYGVESLLENQNMGFNPPLSDSPEFFNEE